MKTSLYRVKNFCDYTEGNIGGICHLLAWQFKINNKMKHKRRRNYIYKTSTFINKKSNLKTLKS